MTDEQSELMRQCAQRVIDNHAAGRGIDPDTLKWAERIVAKLPPMNRPIGDGSSA